MSRWEYPFGDPTLEAALFASEHSKVEVALQKIVTGCKYYRTEKRMIEDEVERNKKDGKSISAEVLMLQDHLDDKVERLVAEGVELGLKRNSIKNKLDEAIKRRDAEVEKARKEKAEKEYKKNYNSTKNRALAGWDPHQDDIPEVRDKYKKIYEQRQRDKERQEDEIDPYTYNPRPSQAILAKFRKDAKEWYDHSYEVIKSRQEVLSFPLPPRYPVCTDIACFMKPRPLKPAC